MTSNKLSRAIHLAIPVAMAIYSAGAYAQSTDSSTTSTTQSDTTPATAKQSAAKSLNAVVVTGSLVSRVDTETASPVTVLDRSQITASGAQTLGDLVQSLPGISGNATNPSVNNGGGDGASKISLRGLGDQRTLVLVDGHRIANSDVNSIPANMIERVEIDKVGASTIYGSDAIGGVVNFILRKDFTGLELNTDYGISSKHDGGRNGDQITFGHAWKRGHIVVGLDYNKQREISTANRSFSKNAMYLSSGSSYAAGSSRTPTGYIALDSANKAKYGCSAVTSGSGGYHCYSSTKDSYNYQAKNLIVTPQRRENAFILGTFNITDNIQLYADLYHDRTSSSSAIAAAPFDAQNDGVTIPATNQYNTFGQEFGSNGYEFRSRWTGLGQRVTNYDTTTDQDILGIKGNFGDSSWSWDVNYDYGHYVQKTSVDGLIDDSALQNALNANTTGLNLFDQSSASTVAWMKAHESVPHTTTDYSSSQWQGSATGELWNMEGGASELAVGALYRSEHENHSVSSNAVTSGSDYTCGVGSSYCGTPLGGGFDVKEAYAQLFLPMLGQDSPIGAFNMTIGDRESSYSSVGKPNNSATVQFEWRPIKDVLVRGTVAQVFRAPTITDLYQGATASAPIFSDPCIGYSGSGHSNACAGVPTGWTGSGLSQTTSIVTGSKAAGVNLKPEKGESLDFGIVFSPSWLPGFSTSVDYWKYSLNNTITAISAQTVVNSCYQDNSSPDCSYIHRYTSGPSAGTINYVQTPTVNLGHLLTEGVDWNLSYLFPQSRFGRFLLNVDTTYTEKYNVDPNPGATGDVVLKLAGSYTSSYGNFSHLRSRATLHWNLGNWSAQWTTRMIGPVHVGFADTAYGYSADYDYSGVVLKYGSRVYHALEMSYTVPAIKTTFSLGVDNLFDKQPPMMYMNNVINSDTDVNTYDVVGRYYWARANIKFW